MDVRTLLFFAAFAGVAFAQTPCSEKTFHNTTVASIVDGDTFPWLSDSPGEPPAYQSFLVSAANSGIISAVQVELRITHPKVGELWLTLISPNGVEVRLTQRDGGDKAGYNTVRFDDTAATVISNAVWSSPAYSGVYKPVGSLSTFVGQNSSGRWRIKAQDYRLNDVGSLQESWLYFCYLHTTTAVVTTAVVTTAVGTTAVGTTAVGTTAVGTTAVGTTAVPPPPPPPPCTAACGDPHFIGLDGVKFEFVGQPDTNFALISDPMIQMNARFVTGTAKRTYMGAICLRACNDTLLVKPPTVASPGMVLLNGNGVGIGRTVAHGKFAVHRSHKHEVEVAFGGRWQFTMKIGDHVDIDQALAGFAYDGKTHGIIGHTLKRTPEQTRACNDHMEGGCEVEGDWHDYIVAGDDLCSTEWKHAQFDGDACAL